MSLACLNCYFAQLNLLKSRVQLCFEARWSRTNHFSLFGAQ